MSETLLTFRDHAKARAEEAVDRPGAATLLGAAVRRETSVGSVLTGDKLDFAQWDGEGYEDQVSSGYLDALEPKYRPYAERFVGLTDEGAATLKRNIDGEVKDLEILDNANGLAEFGAVMAVQAIDPVNYLPLGGAAFKGATFANKVKTGARAGLIGAALQEPILYGTQETRTIEESALNVAASAAFGAILGVGAHGVERAKARLTQSRAMRDIREAETPDDVLLVANEMKAADDPATSIQGHAIEAEREATEFHNARMEAEIRDKYGDDPELLADALFLEEMEQAAGLEARVSEAEAAANAGTIPVLIRTSDDAIQEVQVSAALAKSMDLVKRFEDDGILTARELDEMGIVLQDQRLGRDHVIEYYDMMYARFNGKEVPDNFDPLEDFYAPDQPKAVSEMAKARADVARKRGGMADAIAKALNTKTRAVAKETAEVRREAAKLPRRPVSTSIKEAGGIDPKGAVGLELKAQGVTAKNSPGLFKKGGLKDVDNLDDLSAGELLRTDGNYYDRQDIIDAIVEEVNDAPRRTADQQAAIDAADEADAELSRLSRATDNYVGIIAEVEEVALQMENGGIDRISAQQAIDDLIKDQEFADAIKVCALK